MRAHINTHTDPITFEPGTYVVDAADELAHRATRTGEDQTATFNGTPLTAKPGDLARHVHERWAYEVELSRYRNRFGALP